MGKLWGRLPPRAADEPLPVILTGADWVVATEPVGVIMAAPLLEGESTGVLDPLGGPLGEPLGELPDVGAALLEPGSDPAGDGEFEAEAELGAGVEAGPAAEEPFSVAAAPVVLPAGGSCGTF